MLASLAPWSIGAQWRRWDPHIHTPETLLNDQFEDKWDEYLEKIEKAVPSVEVLGITDYYCLDNYKKVVEHKKAGRLPNVKLIFPNIEMRLTIETKSAKAINLHLLFSPDDPDHLINIQRALRDLPFRSRETDYCCSRDDLIRLGKSRGKTEEHAALKEGAQQFKVGFRDVMKVYQGNPWMQQNCLIAVSGSSNDGTAGLQGDSGWLETREEIERSSHIILIGTDSDRLFWLGRKDGFNKEFIETKYNSLKPCIHGSDAHRVDQVLEPAKNRHCWIKGDPTFEALRQVVLEPESRVHVGEVPPDRVDTGNWITSVTTTNTPWLNQSTIELNRGLIAIIGSRGSGKTALADIIARASGTDQAKKNKKSFLHRAALHLVNSRVLMNWDEGEPSDKSLWTEIRPSDRTYGGDEDSDDVDLGSYEDASALDEGAIRYLSQQFVERLCTSTGLHSELVREIEKVIFYSIEDKMGCRSFRDLLSLKVDPIEHTRHEFQAAISEISDSIVAESVLVENLDKYKKALKAAHDAVKKTEGDMKKLLPAGDKARADQLALLTSAHAAVGTSVDNERRLQQRCVSLRQEARTITSITAPQTLTKLREKFYDLGLNDTEWDNFLLKFTGDVESVIKLEETRIQRRIDSLCKIDPSKTSAYDTLAVEKRPLELLTRQKQELEKLVGIDKANESKYRALAVRLEQENRVVERAKEVHDRAKGAAARKDALTQDRRKYYHDCFDTFVQETKTRSEMYKVLHDAFEKSTGTIGELRFAVARTVDINKWLDKTEDLFDLRTGSTLRGIENFRETLTNYLLPVWQTGDAQAVASQMDSFIKTYYSSLRDMKKSNVVTTLDFARWQQSVAAWLYSTDHITLTYSMTYQGTPIENLSPGTRGIVLLMLYLVIDKHDKRPLLIDQPEENLDPRSVYQELVHHFREARKRRQVIIVTHNANLVVNTDADQVIVAKTTPNQSGGLPTIEYEAGCLENKRIRAAVCEILEGGERAFVDREKRYRLQRKNHDLVT